MDTVSGGVEESGRLGTRLFMYRSFLRWGVKGGINMTGRTAENSLGPVEDCVWGAVVYQIGRVYPPSDL